MLKLSLILCGFALILTGCLGTLTGLDDQIRESQKTVDEINAARPRRDKQIDLMHELGKDPDTPAWAEQRERMHQALGDRVIDKDFDRVFDSAVTAFATLEVKITNMERVSGYISGNGLPISSELSKQLRREGLVEYCTIKGYDPSLLEKRSQYEMDPDVYSGAGWSKYMVGMTISLAKLGPSQTKIKIRFDGVYYPRMLEECYKAVWPAIDKQIFVDKNLETPQKQ
ncbi:MAG TPA: hypothetical protein PK967_20120 [Candidatus Hydrogenedentes bacterium]|nr:hypothetical protein [Candidatus Hydrogenedentota bacterium]